MFYPIFHHVKSVLHGLSYISTGEVSFTWFILYFIMWSQFTCFILYFIMWKQFNVILYFIMWSQLHGYLMVQHVKSVSMFYPIIQHPKSVNMFILHFIMWRQFTCFILYFIIWGQFKCLSYNYIVVTRCPKLLLIRHFVVFSTLVVSSLRHILVPTW